MFFGFGKVIIGTNSKNENIGVSFVHYEEITFNVREFFLIYIYYF